MVIGLIVGSLFYQLGQTANQLRNYFGAGFLIIMFTAMGGMSQVWGVSRGRLTGVGGHWCQRGDIG